MRSTPTARGARRVDDDGRDAPDRAVAGATAPRARAEARDAACRRPRSLEGVLRQAARTPRDQGRQGGGHVLLRYTAQLRVAMAERRAWRGIRSLVRRCSAVYTHDS